MKVRWTFLAAAVFLVMALGIGFAFAGTSSAPTRGAAGCAQIHNTAGMQQMHARMPAAAQVRCDELHSQMETMMSGQMGAAMMGSNGMMTGSTSGPHSDAMMGR